jgi:hypothetical protein
LTELIEVKRALSWGTDRVTELSYAVASARETGKPPGYTSTLLTPFERFHGP